MLSVRVAVTRGIGGPSRYAMGAVLVAVGATLSAAQTPTRNERVIIELTKPIEDERNFNWFVRQPDKKADRREFGAHQVMFEPLFLLNYDTGELEPWLGEKLEPEPIPGEPNRVDFKKWRLTLKTGQQWSDRPSPTPPVPNPPPFPFTSADVVATVNMALSNLSLTALEAVRLREQVESVAPDGTHGVIFTLRKPNPRFAIENFGGGLFSSFLVMPKHHWDGKDAAKFKFATPVGTGPYAYKSVSKDAAVWKRNDVWWDKRYPTSGVDKDAKKKNEEERARFPKEIEWRYVVDEAASRAMLEKGELDAAREYSKDTFEKAQKAGQKNGVRIVGWEDANPAWTDPCTRQLEINLQYSWDDGKGGRVTTPWADPRLRRALALLIDRQKLAADTYEGIARPSVTMFPHYKAMDRFRKAATSADAGYEISETAKPAEAAALFAAAGYAKDTTTGFYKKGEDNLTATIWVNGSRPMDVAAANKLGEQMAKAGIKIDITRDVRSISNGDYWGDVVPKGKYEMAYGWLSCGSIVEPYTSMRRYVMIKGATPKDDRPPAIGVRSPGFDNTGRWTTSAAESYSTIVKTLDERPVQGKLDTEQQKKQAEITENLVKQAYRHLNEEMPFIPLLHVPRLIPVSEKHWVGWPSSKNNRTPMHGWSQMRWTLPGLKKGL
jgi:peptide/nickel transport system substrate-binding protein